MRAMPRFRALVVLLAVGVALVTAPRASAQQPAPASPEDAKVRALEKDALDALRAGEPAKAVEIARQAVALAGELGLAKVQADVRRTLARCLTQTGGHAAALRELDAAEPVYARIGDEYNRVGTIANRGVVLRLIGDFTEALRLQRVVLAYEEANSEPQAIASVLNNIGIVESLRGNYRASAEAFERALTLATEEETRVRLLGNVALTYGKQGEVELCLRFLKEAAEYAAKQGNKIEALTRQLNYAATLNDAGRWDEGLAHARATLAEVPADGGFRGVAGLNNEIGRALLALDRVDEAGAAYDAGLARARDGAEPDDVVFALCGVAQVRSRQGAHDRAEAAAREALVEAERVQGPRLLVSARETLGDVLRAAGKLPEARAAYDGAIATVEALRGQTAGGDAEQLRFFEQQLPPYHAQIALLIGQGAFEDALAYMERARGRVLVDVLQRGRTTLPGALTPEERSEERRLAAATVTAAAQRRIAKGDAALAAADAVLQRTREDADRWRLQMLARYPRTRAATSGVQFAGLDAARPLVADGATLVLAYTVTGKQTHVASIVRGTDRPVLKVVTLPIGRDALAARVQAFRRRVAARDLGVAADARALFDLIVAPAGDVLAGARRVLIAPDASLWELPFQALQGPDGRYLVERAAIAYAPSLTALVSPRAGPRADAATRDLLALGNPALRGADALPPLAEAERQVTAIAQRFPVAQRHVRIGAAATEALVKTEAGRSRIVHIAAHGTLDASSPMYSALILAPGPDGSDDGRFEARELVELDLRDALVVMSACETARGRVAAGEGLIGLSWAALVAGARRVVVSQWKVDAASTTDLMTGFYRHLRPGAAGAAQDEAQALRGAALDLLRSPTYRHPFYWAAFTVVGG